MRPNITIVPLSASAESSPSPRSVRAFLIGTFAFSWITWLGLLAAAYVGLLSREKLSALYVIGVAGPSLVAFTLVWRADGARGAAAFGRSVLYWRAPARWYAFALLAPFVVRLLALGIFAALGGTILPVSINPAALLIIFVVTLIVPLMEEYGWRGYLQPSLAQGRSAVTVGLLVGVAWAIWHLPLFWFPGTGFFRWAEASGVIAAIAGYATSVVSLAMLFTLVYQRTRGTLLLAFLLHDAVNTSSDVLLAPYARSGVVGPAWCTLAVLLAAGGAAAWALSNDRAYPTIHPVEPGITAS